MKTINVSVCFSEITPESAERGDFSDHGFVFENESLSFRELVDLIERNGFSREGSTEWLTTGYSVQDYSTATEREETLHFSRSNPERLRKYFDLAMRTVEERQVRRRLKGWRVVTG